MTVLVTGGAGFIGGKLVRELLARGETVRLLDLRASSATHLADLGAEIVEGDVLSDDQVREALDGCERLFHVAALFRMWRPDRRSYHRVNVEGTRNVLEIALDIGVRKAVFTSSAVTIGEARGQVGHETTSHREYFLSEYERSKYLGEQVAFEACVRGLPLVVVNPTSVYGPGQTAHMTGAISRFLNGRLPAIVDAELNFVYVDDVVAGHLRAMERGQVGERYILGGENSSLGQFLALAAEMAGVHSKPRSVPAYLVKSVAWVLDAVSHVTRRRPWVSIDEARTAAHSFLFDTRKAREELGLECTSLREGLQRTISWLRDEGLVPAS
jgi:dihydroflavonol-4-reductase